MEGEKGGGYNQGRQQLDIPWDGSEMDEREGIGDIAGRKTGKYGPLWVFVHPSEIKSLLG